MSTLRSAQPLPGVRTNLIVLRELLARGDTQFHTFGLHLLVHITSLENHFRSATFRTLRRPPMNLLERADTYAVSFHLSAEFLHHHLPQPLYREH